MSPCDKCTNLVYHGKKVTCLAGHSPRFHMPKNELDSDYGWKKRNCPDYAMKPEDGRDECINLFDQSPTNKTMNTQPTPWEFIARVIEQQDRLAAALRLIAEGTSCRECGGEDEARFALEALQSLTPNEINQP